MFVRVFYPFDPNTIGKLLHRKQFFHLNEHFSCKITWNLDHPENASDDCLTIQVIYIWKAYVITVTCVTFYSNLNNMHRNGIALKNMHFDVFFSFVTPCIFLAIEKHEQKVVSWQSLFSKLFKNANFVHFRWIQVKLSQFWFKKVWFLWMCRCYTIRVRT